ncbi:MAG: ATP-binding cassette domain-containing protein [Bacteroidales bacterium]|nr:ATP-binding cassette domain-containing protein [Bacteroidales bacterium]
MKHILETDSIILEFGEKKVLSDVYLKIKTGEIIGLLGRNGAGKSCLMNIIYGELNPFDKSVRIDGKVFFEAYKYPNIIKYMPQFNFVPQSLKLNRIFKDFNLEYDELTELFPDFSSCYNFPLRKLSGGQNRIIELYVILKSKSQFCMLDEPFSHLMPIQTEAVKKLIQKEKLNKGILITDHMYDHIIDISDRIYVIKNGKTHLINSIQEIEDLGYAKINR